MIDTTKITMTPDIKPEEKIEFDIEVSEFDQEPAQIESEEDFDEKTIMFVERQIRNSYEYRSYIKYLKQELDLTTCALLPNVDIKTTPVSLEFHHFPLTLFDITQIVGISMIRNVEEGDTLSTLDIAEKVLLEHYKNNVGLVPVTKTIHEMAHNGSIIIPFDKINGRYDRFLETYSEEIPEGLADRIASMKIFNSSDEAIQFNDYKLTKKIVNYNIEYLTDDNDDE